MHYSVANESVHLLARGYGAGCCDIIKITAKTHFYFEF